MAFYTHRVPVRTSLDTLWSLLLDKIRRPDRYIDGVEQVEILDDIGPMAIERRMHIRSSSHVTAVRERILADESTHTVLFKLQGDPVFTGWVVNVIHEDGEHLELEYAMHWTPRPGAQVPERDWQGAITRAVEHTREMAEGRDA
ncbi:AtaL-like protein [Ramlibacter sp. PS3R-8]|uniref:AtaL-like protein n=1 Tax=Ramlibacter sp. PS3R-8 TaxID=3133437 RepID=UPI0030A7BE2F